MSCAERQNHTLVEGLVDTRKEHIEIRFCEDKCASAIIMQGENGDYIYHFLPNTMFNKVRKEKVLKDLQFFLIDKGEEDPWQYASDYAKNAAAEMYSDVHWEYYENGRTPSKQVTNLLLKIAHCNNTCNTQKQYLPEPWNGWIDRVPILYVSSNPAMSVDEISPTNEWSDTHIIDFFMNRFNKNGPYSKEYVKYRRFPENLERYKFVQFWSQVMLLTEELTGVDRDLILPGIDYAMTEIVHCKSKKQDGVYKAVERCCREYLEEVINTSSARIIISLGDYASNAINTVYNLKLSPKHKGSHLDVIKQSSELSHKLILSLPHPRYLALKKMKVTDFLSFDELYAVRCHLSSF